MQYWFWNVWLIFKTRDSLIFSSSFHNICSFQYYLWPIAIIILMWKA